MKLTKQDLNSPAKRFFYKLLLSIKYGKNPYRILRKSTYPIDLDSYPLHKLSKQLNSTDEFNYVQYLFGGKNER